MPNRPRSKIIGSVSGESTGTTFITQIFKSLKAAANLEYKKQREVCQIQVIIMACQHNSEKHLKLQFLLTLHKLISCP
jgi:hypothetical protein